MNAVSDEKNSMPIYGQHQMLGRVKTQCLPIEDPGSCRNQRCSRQYTGANFFHQLTQTTYTHFRCSGVALQP